MDLFHVYSRHVKIRQTWKNNFAYKRKYTVSLQRWSKCFEFDLYKSEYIHGPSTGIQKSHFVLNVY